MHESFNIDDDLIIQSTRQARDDGVVAPALRLAMYAVLAFLLGFPGVAASANGDPAIDAAERELARLQTEQKRLLKELKRDLASLPQPPVPASSSGAPEDDSRAKLMKSIAEIEKRINAESSVRTGYATPATTEVALHAYYKRFSHRVEQQGNVNLAQIDGVAHGRVVVFVTLTPAGRIESIETGQSASDALAAQAIGLLRQLEPFERFPAEIAKKVDRLVLTAPFNYSRK